MLDRHAISMSFAYLRFFSYSFNFIVFIDAKYYVQASSSLFSLKKLVA